MAADRDTSIDRSFENEAIRMAFRITEQTPASIGGCSKPPLNIGITGHDKGIAPCSGMLFAQTFGHKLCRSIDAGARYREHV
ncbi:hypothetical protein FEF65_06420 [Mariprofundus erugo]|uniref:Uncharacterized protein n=1 Tax=Mariprofundus erugo TaxID=2528639 RepID=A0A5R9GPL5_9PROT|nr:hypothetical protein [Mariprofundus erugo]TLS67548.1 hypothetical protein FEF65_06420 [Mariprofundus erugo]